MKFLTSLLVCFASFLVFITFDSWLSIIKGHDVPEKHKALLLVIGIVSSRRNFKARESVRNTWKMNANLTEEKYYFLIGKHFCKIPVADRVSEYSCEEWNVTIPEGLEETTEIYSSKTRNDNRKVLDPSLNIFVHHNVIIRRLCILTHLIKNTTKVSVVDLSTGDIIISATFFTSTSNINTPFICKSVELFEFPKQFEGKIIIDSFHAVAKCNVAITDLSQIITYKTSLPYQNLSDVCAPISLIYTVQDVKSLKDHIIWKFKRKDNWIKQQQFEEKQLLEESRIHQDIIFLDVVDVYRNLPAKILHFFKWIKEEKIRFQFLLKTDDDVFIDINQVRSKLQNVGSVSNWWWSSFRENWPVQKFGKWRDDMYHSITYPPFPCGAGYVLSQDLVEYLAINTDKLYCYQGEDVSLGIWLAPLKPAMKKDCWQCSGCVQHACNKPELTLKQMYQTWDLFVNHLSGRDICNK